MDLKCVLPYSLPAGTTIPTKDFELLCASAYAGPKDGLQSPTITCQNAPKNTKPYLTGLATAEACPFTITPTEGAAITNPGIPAVCGYNQDAMFYCPWQLGDDIPAKAIAAMSAIYKIANTKCGVKSQGIADCAATGKLADNLLNYAKFSFIDGGVDEKTFFNNVNGPLVANNADCVKKTLTAGFFGAATSVYGMIGATAAVLAMMI